MNTETRNKFIVGDSVLIKDPKSEGSKYTQYVNKTGVIISIFNKPIGGAWDDTPRFECIILIDGDFFGKRMYPFIELELIKESDRKIKSCDLSDKYDFVLDQLVKTQVTDVQQKLYQADAIKELARRKKDNIKVVYNDSYDFY